MAILPTIPGLEVTILVDGVAAAEYGDPDAEENTRASLLPKYDLPPGPSDLQTVPYVVKYIEAKPGAAFEIQVVKTALFERRSHHIAHRIKLDGRVCLSMAHEGGDGAPRSEWRRITGTVLSGSPAAGYKAHKFLFSPLSTVDDSSGNSLPFAKTCGTIITSLYHMNRCRDRVGATIRDKAPELGAVKLSEKALKGRAVDCLTR